MAQDEDQSSESQSCTYLEMIVSRDVNYKEKKEHAIDSVDWLLCDNRTSLEVWCVQFIDYLFTLVACSLYKGTRN